ncbi:APC family permease [Pseudomonas defluvii]|jgi:amino acid transporter|uniref:APC family permease n=1 Tax=Pseudomonas defluvii TaxID=1876757 RepID=UPI00081149F4|nr:APC family permease [Pseudomonas defluvii]
MAIEQFGYQQQLRRSLSLKDLVIYGMIFMIPIAPFGVYGWVHADSGGMVPMAYLVGMVAMLFTALSYGAMARAFPIAGSVYSYAQRGIHPNVGFMAGWVLLLDYLLIPPLLYVFSALALNHLFPQVPKLAWMVIFLVSSTLVNLRGVTLAARVNLFFLIAEILVLAIFITFGLIALNNGMGNGSLTLKPFYQPEYFDLSLVMKAVSIAVLSFLGFDAISTLAEEVKGDPAKQIGRASLIALFLMGGIFILQTWLASDLAAGMTFSSADTAFYEIAGAVGGPWLGTLAAVSTALAWGVTVSITSQAAVSRLLFSMARDGKLPHVLASVHPRFKTPHVSLYLVSLLALLIGAVFLDTPDLLTSLVNFGALASFCLLHLSVINHYIVRQKSRRYALYLLSPLVGLVIIAYVLISMSHQAQLLGLGWMAVGLVYLVFLQRRKGSAELAREM